MPERHLNPLLLVTLVAACLAGTELAHLSPFYVGELQMPVIWPAAGILIAVLLLAERGRALALASTSVLMGVILHWHYDWPLALSIGVGLTQGLEAWMGAWLLHRLFAEPFSLGSTRHVSAFIATVIGTTMIGGLVLAELVTITLGNTPVREAWLTWWFADALGMLLATPIVLGILTFWSASRTGINGRRVLEALIVLGGTALTNYAVFSDVLPPYMRLPAYVLPWFVWASFRFGAGGAAAALFVTSLFAASYAVQGLGPFARPGEGPDAWVLRTQGAASMAALSFMLLGSLVDERRRALRERDDLVEKLQSTLSELRILQGMIPICAWCHKIRDDAGYWQQIETYVEAHSAATFSHSICPTCTMEHDPTAPGQAPGLAALNPTPR